MLAASVTWRSKVSFPAVVGVPERAPLELRVNPGGGEVLLIAAHVYGRNPTLNGSLETIAHTDLSGSRQWRDDGQRSAADRQLEGCTRRLRDGL